MEQVFIRSKRFDRARMLLDTVTSILPDSDGLTYARPTNLLGLTCLDIYQPTRALDLFQNSLVLRRQLLGPDNTFTASSLSNVSLAYTELSSSTDL